MTTQNPTTIVTPAGTPFIEITREFEATPEQVYRAYTDPEIVVQWLGPREYKMELGEYDARPGGSWSYTHRDDDGNAYGFRGVFHTADPDAKRLVQTFEFAGAPGHVCLESASFEDLGGRTRVVTHSVYQSVEARDAMVESGMESGLTDSMSRLDEVLATTA